MHGNHKSNKKKYFILLVVVSWQHALAQTFTYNGATGAVSIPSNFTYNGSNYLALSIVSDLQDCGNYPSGVYNVIIA